MAIPRFMLVLGALTLRGHVLLFETLRSLVDDICHVDVTGRVNIVNKAPEYCAVHPKWADGYSVVKKPGSGAFVPQEPPLGIEVLSTRSNGHRTERGRVIFYYRLGAKDVVEFERFVDLDE